MTLDNTRSTVSAAPSGAALARHKLSLCLWFDGKAEEAARFYVSLFDNSRITHIARYPQTDQVLHGRQGGSVMTVSFELDGQPVVALNGGPEFSFNWAVSLQIDCRDQAEVDRYWSTLAEGGKEGQCGWLRDRFGLPWQVIPRRLTELMSHPDPAVPGRVMQALMGMTRIDVEALERAAGAGGGADPKPAD